MPPKFGSMEVQIFLRWIDSGLNLGSANFVFVTMSDLGGIEATIYWASTSGDLTDRDPSLSVVAVPVSVSEEALFIQGASIRMQILRAKVNDNDLEQAKLGDCSGYLTVYPGYLSKKQEPPLEFALTYAIDWCVLYRDEKYYYITMRANGYVNGEGIDFFWGRES